MYVVNNAYSMHAPVAVPDSADSCQIWARAILGPPHRHDSAPRAFPENRLPGGVVVILRKA